MCKRREENCCGLDAVCSKLRLAKRKIANFLGTALEANCVKMSALGLSFSGRTEVSKTFNGGSIPSRPAF